MLAVSYKDGTVILYNVGAGRIVHQIQLGSSSSSNTSDEVVSDMHWAKVGVILPQRFPLFYRPDALLFSPQIAVPKDTYIDPLATLSELQPLSLGHNHATLDDTPPAEPTMLVLGTTAGHISFYAFGVAPCGRVDTGQRGPVQQLALAPNMSAVAALVGESPQFVVVSLSE